MDISGVSRRHARIVIDKGGAVLEDLGSKNGTKLRDQLVKVITTIRDGDQIQLGPVVVIFHASASGMSTDTLAPVNRNQRPDSEV
jgi:pSer/pThr/pTyr-binding forkhead associated (FHA) protein